MRLTTLFFGMIFPFLFLSSAQAGFIEIGATGSYRSSYVNEYNYSKTQALTGSLAYYFWEMSAIEVSYTNGTNQTFGRTITNEDYIATTTFEFVGVDLVLSLAGKQAPFRPYFKIGGSYQRKKISYEQGYFSPFIQEVYGFAPTVGAGFKLMLTEALAFKLGGDAWGSPDNTNRFDLAASAGLSWLF